MNNRLRQWGKQGFNHQMLLLNLQGISLKAMQFKLNV